jgi:MFS family permease
MSGPTSGPVGSTRGPGRALSGLLAIAFAGCIIIGLGLPVLPLYVTEQLGFGPFIVGLAAGTQFAVSLVSRIPAGRYADRNGGQGAARLGLFAAILAGLLYLASLALVSAPLVSATVLVLARGVLGASQSFLLTGVLAWGLTLVDQRHAGTVMSWIGTAMYGAMAAGAPLGTLLYANHGFAAIGLLTILFPLAALPLATLRPMAGIRPGPQQSVGSVIRAVWLPGLGLAFSSLGFGATTAFITLLYSERGWSNIWVPFTAFSLAFMVARIALGHLPDRWGGARVALACVCVEAAGQAMIAFAGTPTVAAAGAALSGLGYSLVYPGLGVEAVRRTPPAHRGLAMGTYTAFLDIALGLTSPALGYAASVAGLPAVFLMSAIGVLGTVPVAVALMLQSGQSGSSA